MSERILIVEDERDLVETLEYNLEKGGYETRSTQFGEEALILVEESPRPDLVLLDLMLPDISGIEVCREIRANPETEHLPVLMLTARGEEIDRVVGFEAGADDYVVKPFSTKELVLRIRAILRRSRREFADSERTPSEAEDGSDELTFGELRIDVPGHRVWIGDEQLELTSLEFDLLTTFVRRRGRAQTRDTLLSDVWGITADVKTRTVDTHVKRLREKLGPAGDYIETVRGVGYRFRDEPPDDES